MTAAALTRTALVLSPHLDDAAFSCGGTMAVMADAGWRVCLVTAFTRSMVPATGFALDCQLDKGLPAEVDYMALRRAEDRVAAEMLGAEVRWLDLLEAPHRGYGEAAALFGAIREGDDVWRELAGMIAALVAELRPVVLLAPQGLGNHVDHQQMIHAVRAGAPDEAIAYYRDTPYAIRNICALPSVTGVGLTESMVSIGPGLERKVAASCAYASQIGFQFGGAAALGETLRAFAAREGSGEAAERFIGQVPLHQH